MSLNLPPNLISAVTEQRAVLFLGAGASRQAKHPQGTKIPQGEQLRDLISDKFLGGELKQKTLTTVSAMAASEAGLADFQRWIRDLFEPFEPNDFHFLIPQFRWKAIVTTNFDLIIERAYATATQRLQNLVKTVKDGDGFDPRMSRETNPVGFYKLHGCIDHYTDQDIPFILSTEQYADYERNRKLFYGRFRALGHDYPIVFAGYSLSDPHIQRILFDLTDQKIPRPPFFLVAPGITNFEQRYWMRNNVVCLDSTLKDFLETLDKAIPSTARAIPIGTGGGELSIRQHYRVVDVQEPPLITNYLSVDVQHIHGGLNPPIQDAVKFYKGYDEGFGCIVQNLDAKRTIVDSVLVDAILKDEAERKIAELYVLKGPAGNGKTVALKRIAWETGVTYEQLTFYVAGAAGLRIEPLAEISRLTGKRVFLFVDHIALTRYEVRDLLHSATSRSIPITIIGTERDNEWNIYCEHLEPFLQQDFAVRYLSETEINELIGLLERHRALGDLEDQSPEGRVRAFSEAAERQLLVALHSATRGVPFEDIIIDEFRRIEPEAAKNLYLDICALHQFGAPVRVGLISRTTGVNFDRFKKELIGPLSSVVQVIENRHANDIFYVSRHRHVAEILFNKWVPTPEARFDLLARLIGAINVDYSSDRETFGRLIRGRAIVDMFPNVELGRLFYLRVQDAAPDDPFVLHQRAVFEINHPGGSLQQAEQAAARAYELRPNSHSIQHTQAEIARRQANATENPLRKRALRRTTREKLGDLVTRMSEYDLHTRAKLAIDEFKELSSSLSLGDQGQTPRELIEAAKDAETTLQRGLQLFPESAELLAAEATFREHLDQTERARKALERAFANNPRQDWLAVRLARKYWDGGDPNLAKTVLETCLRDNPSSKIANLELGKLLVEESDAGAVNYLRRAYTEGDNHFEGQFWYARELFLTGDTSNAARLFTAINDRAPGRFRIKTDARASRDGQPKVYRCRVMRKEEGYAFIHIDEFPKDVFASRSESDSEEWDKLVNGSEARCQIGFNRRGPRAILVQV